MPTFWTGDPTNLFAPPRHRDSPPEPRTSQFISSLVTLAGLLVFGAVHCIAWDYALPILIELVLWRVSAVTVTATPVSMVLLYVLLVIPELMGCDDLLEPITKWMSLAIVVAYFMARLVLLAIAFSSLRALAYNVYRTPPALPVP